MINGDNRKAEIKLTGGELSDILRQLDLILEGNKSGLGTLNLLCISAELLLMQQQTKGLKLALIEELEAHLHPQYQLRLIDYITTSSKDEQFILSTHSITLASKLKIENIVVLNKDNAYPLSQECTGMSEADYKFLERFLDATKANIFFAKGVIMVEGDAENLLIPAIAQCIGWPLHQYGVSIINVGSTAYKRYVSLFRRKDGQILSTKVAVITDLDVRAKEYYEDGHAYKLWKTSDILPDLKRITDAVEYNNFPEYIFSKDELEKLVRANKKNDFPSPICPTINDVRNILDNTRTCIPSDDLLNSIREKRKAKLEGEFDFGNIKIFLPKEWTLEYDIARSGLARLLFLSIKLANYPENAEVTEKTISDEIEEVLKAYPKSHEITQQDSYQIFKPLNDGDVSKAITAQYLASFVSGETSCDNLMTNDEIKHELQTDNYLSYLREAIEYVTQQ